MKAALLVALAAFCGAGAVQADTTVAKSRSTDAYGGGDTAAAAMVQCTLTMSLDCAPVITCSGSHWIGIARPESPGSGLAVVCGQRDPDTARLMAVAICMEAANDLCWTSDVIDPGGQALPREVNRAFDRAAHGGALLRLAGFSWAGNLGERTEALSGAVAAFEQRLELGFTGSIDRQNLSLLLAAAGGRQAYADAMTAWLVAPNRAALEGRTYVWMAHPALHRSFSDELLALPREEQQHALVALLMARGVPCLGWMGEVTQPVPPSISWGLLCQDGRHVLTLAPGGITIDTTPIDPDTDPLRME